MCRELDKASITSSGGAPRTLKDVGEQVHADGALEVFRCDAETRVREDVRLLDSVYDAVLTGSFYHYLGKELL